MSKLSTGQPNTLGTYLKNCTAIFGKDSAATKYIQDMIDEQGEDEEIVADESQFLHLLGMMHTGKGKK